MIKPQKHPQEAQRLDDLESYSILDTMPEEDFDALTRIASEICDTPISLVSLIDKKRQWFKSHTGLDATETPKEYAFCAHAINDPENILIVQDARKDERFYDNPLVTGQPNVIFYAGVPLNSHNGLPLGTLCVIDNQPKLLSQSQVKSLEALSKQVMNVMDLRRKKLLLEASLSELEERNQELQAFAYVAAHDIKSPLRNIMMITKRLSALLGSTAGSEAAGLVEMISTSTGKLKNLVDGLLKYSTSQRILRQESTIIKIHDLIEDVKGLFMDYGDCKIEFDSDIQTIKSNRTAIQQILINLVGNAIKYSDKPDPVIAIGLTEQKTLFEFFVQDDGPGIEAKYHDKIFKIFEVLKSSDRFGERGSGIGLATVKKIVEGLGGAIRIDSEPGKGARFTFTIRNQNQGERDPEGSHS